MLSYPPSLADLQRRKWAQDRSKPQGGSTVAERRGALTQHADEGVGQQVAVLVGGVALVHSPAADLGVPEDDGVPGHLTVWVAWCRCRQERLSL